MNRPSLCPKCRTLVGADETQCYKCGASLGTAGRFVHGAVRGSQELGREAAWWQLILGANIALYLVGIGITLKSGQSIGGGGLFALSASSETLTRLGMQTSGLVAEGQWWRVVTSTFLHAGLMHIGFNMYFLAQLGPAAEKIFGQRGFLSIYVLGGVVGGLVQLSIGGDVVGASGCLMALIGALAGYGRLQSGSWKNPLSRDMFRTLVFITLIGLLPGLHAAHGSHIGGFVGGVAMLFLVNRLIQARQLPLLTWLARGCIGLVAVSMIAMASAPSLPSRTDVKDYDSCLRSGAVAAQQALLNESRAKPPSCLDVDHGFGEQGAAFRGEMADLLANVGMASAPERVMEDLQDLIGRYELWMSRYLRLVGLEWRKQ